MDSKIITPNKVSLMTLTVYWGSLLLAEAIRAITLATSFEVDVLCWFAFLLRD